MRRHICSDPEASLGKVYGSGHCAVAVEMMVPDLGLTKGWRRGVRVLDSDTIPKGTVIATFDPDGTYGNHTDGRSHVAIFMGYALDGGIQVIDAWQGQPVHRRTIHPGHHPDVNDATKFYVVETEDA